MMKRHLFIFYFFLSGTCGLIYEVVWVRLLGLVVGVTIYSFTTVIVAFMAGLALGGYLGGRYADKTVRNPLKVYGVLEAAIGIYALFIPYLIQGLSPLFSFFYQNLEESSLVFLLLRFFLCAVVLLVPTTMMGATLPVLVRHSYAGRDHFGWTTGRLYAVNTIGAVFGSFISGFILIPRFGQMNTIYAAALINLLIFGLIFIFHRGEEEQAAKAPSLLEGIRERLNPVSPSALIILLGYGLSGAAALSYQIAWTNALILSIGTTMYAVGLILSAFISGLGIGSAVMSPFVDRIKRPVLWAGLIEIGIAFTAIAVVPALGRMPLWVLRFPLTGSYTQNMIIKFSLTFALIFIPTFLMGALLPLVARIYQERRGGAGRAAGHIYSSNTAGSVLGSFITGIFLISWIGLRLTIISASVVNFLIGAAFLSFSETHRFQKAVITAAFAVILFFSAWLLPSWHKDIMVSAPYVYYYQYKNIIKEKEELFPFLTSHHEILYYKEGATAVVSVTRDNLTNGISLRINGKADASNTMDMPTQLLGGHLPMLLSHNPERVMVLGLASGVSLGAVTRYPVKEIDCLEISPEVVEASHFFDDVNNDPLSDSRVNLILNDGRHHLAYSGKRYDVIISEPSNPWISGMGILFTKEFFELVKDRLSDPGIFLCWLEIYDLDEEMTRLFIRTFGEVFPEMSLWESIPGNDYFLIGYNENFQVNLDQYLKNFNNIEVSEDLARINEDPARVLARFIMGPKALARFAGEGPLHSDDERNMEFILPKRMANRSYPERTHPVFKQFLVHSESIIPYIYSPDPQNIEKILPRLRECQKAQTYIMESLIARTDAPSRYKEELDYLKRAWEMIPGNHWLNKRLIDIYYARANAGFKNSDIEHGASDLKRIASMGHQDTLVFDALGKIAYDKNDLEEAKGWFEASLDVDPKDARALLFMGMLKARSGQYEESVRNFRDALDYFLEFQEKDRLRKYYHGLTGFVGWQVDAMALEQLGRIYLQQGDLVKAEELFRRALSISGDFENARLGLAVTLVRTQRFYDAEKEYEAILEDNPDNAWAHFYLGDILFRLRGRDEDARRHWMKVLELNPEFPAKDVIRQRLFQ